MFIVKFDETSFQNDTLSEEEFFGLVKFSTTGPANFECFKDIVLSSDEWRVISFDNVDVSGHENHADYESMTAKFGGIEVNLESMPAEYPGLPSWTNNLERCYSEMVEFDYNDPEVEEYSNDVWGEERASAQGQAVNLLSSKVKGKSRHKIVLDIDHEAKLIPSSTPGHYHLLIDYELSEEEWEGLVGHLHAVGLIADGNKRQMDVWMAQYVRLPGVKKMKRQKPVEPFLVPGVTSNSLDTSIPF